MSNIEVGDYLRISGKIAKVTAIDENYIDVDNEELIGIPKNTLKYIIYNHSKNIIDLIEVGDYVNGELVTSVYDENKEDEQIQIEVNNQGNYTYYINEDIKSIVTKEQFKNVSYEVE